MLHVASCVSEQRRSQVETKVKTKDAKTQTQNGKDKDKEKKRNEMRRFYKKQIDSISVSSSQRAAHYEQNTLGGSGRLKEAGRGPWTYRIVPTSRRRTLVPQRLQLIKVLGLRQGRLLGPKIRL